MNRTLGEFARCCGGRLLGADGPYSGVSSDTRSVARGELFVALRGPRFDGSEFLETARERGAAGAVTATARPVALPQIIVPDTQGALEQAGRVWRGQFAIPLIAVAGSNGKTTAKEMTASILGQQGPCLATRGNLNNHIGVPLTLLRLESQHRAAVVEVGANAPGEVAGLVAIARPTVGLITNAGAEHLEGFGSLEGVARAEGEMVEGLEPSATAVINADDRFARLWRGLTRARIVSFGLGAGADFQASALQTEVSEQGFRTHFVLHTPAGAVPVELALGGRHNVMNALAAAAAAAAAGATPAQIAAGLAAMRAVAGRLQFKRTARGAWIIDDSYNANPSSMQAAVEVLAELGGERWMVIGDMAELGAQAEAAHRDLGRLVRERGIERLYAIGALARLAVESFGSNGRWCADAAELAAALLGDLESNPESELRLLVKGSRMNRLERVVEALVAGAAAGSVH